MSARSALYFGSVRHRRHRDPRHGFRRPLFLFYLDLDELPTVLDASAWTSARRRAPLSFHRGDHLGGGQRPLAEAVREIAAGALGYPPAGPIRLLTHLRVLGYCFNPVSFYYCFDRAEAHLECVVAEITNTPWGERHVYVLADESPIPAGREMRCRHAKTFHVSPFQPMGLAYRWRLRAPGERLTVHVDLDRDGERVFDATLALRRRALDRAGVRTALRHSPWITAQVILAIYWQALRLRLRRAPFHPHPER